MDLPAGPEPRTPNAPIFALAPYRGWWAEASEAAHDPGRDAPQRVPGRSLELGTDGIEWEVISYA